MVPTYLLPAKERRLLGKFHDSNKTERLVCVETDGQHDFMGSETLSSTCYIVSDESSIPFYLRVNACYILPTNIVYPFTLRVTGIIKSRENAIVEYLDYQIVAHREMEICKQQSEIKMTKEKWRYASSKAMEMEICKQQSETEMRKWRYASSKARLKCAVEICKQQSEIKIRHGTAFFCLLHTFRRI